MEEKLINLETAVLLKDKSFVEEVHNYFSKDKDEKNFSLKQGFNDNYWGDNYNHNWNDREPFRPFNENCYSAPPQSLVQKWLREVHNIEFDIIVTKIGENRKSYDIFIIDTSKVEVKQNKKVLYSFFNFKNYEEVLELGLQEALKLIK